MCECRSNSLFYDYNGLFQFVTNYLLGLLMVSVECARYVQVLRCSCCRVASLWLAPRTPQLTTTLHINPTACISSTSHVRPTTNLFWPLVASLAVPNLPRGRGISLFWQTCFLGGFQWNSCLEQLIHPQPRGPEPKILPGISMMH